MHAPLLVDLQGPRLEPDERTLLQHPGVAGVCLFSRNLVDVEQARELVADLHATARRPLVIAIDQEGGGVVRLPALSVAPSAMALGAVDDPDLTERLGLATGRGLRRIGVNVDFAPVADVQSNPANPVIGDRAFGADPELVARHVAAFVRGLQSSGVAASLKHFPGHGDVAQDSHLALPRSDANLARLEAVEWRPFAAGIAAGAASVMTGHLLLPALDEALPATLSSKVLGGVLRERLGFEGLVFSDALDMRAIAERWGVSEGAVLASVAGVDVPVVCNGNVAGYEATLAALGRAQREGRLRPERACGRLARLLKAYPSAAAQADAGLLEADAEAEREAARRAITALGRPPRLVPGAPLALLGRAEVRSSAASDTARPVAALVEALEAAGLPVRWVHEPEALQSVLAGAQALLVTTSERAPLTREAVRGYREGFERGWAAGLPTLHVGLWNPDHARHLPGPALLSFGFRPASVAALAQALLTGDAPGHPPVPLATEEGA